MRLSRVIGLCLVHYHFSESHKLYTGLAAIQYLYNICMHAIVTVADFPFHVPLCTIHSLSTQYGSDAIRGYILTEVAQEPRRLQGDARV